MISIYARYTESAPDHHGIAQIAICLEPKTAIVPRALYQRDQSDYDRAVRILSRASLPVREFTAAEYGSKLAFVACSLDPGQYRAVEGELSGIRRFRPNSVTNDRLDRLITRLFVLRDGPPASEPRSQSPARL